MLKSIDPIVFSCYYTVFEYLIAGNIYMETAKDYKKVIYNLAHNLGSIYDHTWEFGIRLYNYENEWDSEEFWKRMGIIFGTNFQSTFEDPANYYEFDPENINHYEERLAEEEEQ